MRPLLFVRRPAFAVALACLVALAPSGASAQSAAGAWRAFPAFNEVTALTSSGEAVWAGTVAGVFSYTPSTGEMRRFTPVDGLRGGTLRAMAFDRQRGALWIGYADGGLDRLDAASGAVTRIDDVARATQFASRGIRRIRAVGDSLYLATDFGVVVYDAAQQQVRNTYSRLGTLNAGTPVNDVLRAPLPDGRAGLWVATDLGLVSAPADAALQTPSVWTTVPNFAVLATSLAYFNSRLHVGGGPAGARDVYARADDGAWQRVFFTNEEMLQLEVDRDGRLLAVGPFSVYVVRPGGPVSRFASPEVIALVGVAQTSDGRLWAGDGALGVLPLASDPPPGTQPFELAPVVPSGPATNRIADVDIAPDGTVWVATKTFARSSAAAVGRFDGTTWTNYRTTDPTVDIARTEFLTIVAAPDGRVYTGSEGTRATHDDGLTVFSRDGVPTLYNETNSTLRGAASLPPSPPANPTGYVIVADMAVEGGRRWVIDREAAFTLHLFDENDRWTALPTPAALQGVTRITRIVVDGFGQKWLALERGGLGVWDTGADPASGADDRARRYPSAGALGQGLPDVTVRALALDGAGRLWIGTERGIAYIFSPGAAFGGDPALATPQWPIVVGADGGDEANYLLRDTRVNDMATDPAGRIWVATASGAFLLNEAGNDIDRTITSANSPLPDDNIERVAVDPVSGRIYLVTPSGLFSAPGDATEARPSSTALTVAPAPYRPALHADGVRIGGLNASRSQVRILTVDGEVVHAREARGGSFVWDGTDDRSGRPVASGVYIVAAASDSGETIYGKVAVIR